MATSQEQQQRTQALDMALRTPGVRDAHHALKIAAAYQSYVASGDPSGDQAKADSTASMPQQANCHTDELRVTGSITTGPLCIRDAQGNTILGAVLTLPANRINPT